MWDRIRISSCNPRTLIKVSHSYTWNNRSNPSKPTGAAANKLSAYTKPPANPAQTTKSSCGHYTKYNCQETKNKFKNYPPRRTMGIL